MGQMSSSQNPTAITERIGEEQSAQAETRKQKHRAKSKKRKRGGPVTDTRQEEESALTLLQLRRNAVQGGQMFSNEDNFAASTQLILESSPHHPTATHNIEHASSEISEESGDRALNGGTRKQKKNKKTKRHHSETLEEEYSLAAIKNLAEGPPGKKVKTSLLPVSSPNQLRQHKSTLSLDDINSGDEDIASYLQEYENEAINQSSIFPSQTEAIESVSQMQQLAATVDHNTSEALDQFSYSLPSNSGKIVSQQEKRKKNVETVPDLELDLVNSYPVNQESQEDRDQPVFDHVAFDNYFNNLPDSVNGLNQAPSEDIPIDPEISQNGISLAPSEDDMTFDREYARTQQRARKGKAQRVYSSARKRNSRKELTQNSPSNSLPHESPEYVEHQQDKVLPGIEDVERRSSSRKSLSEASHRRSEVSSRESEISSRESDVSYRESEISSIEFEVPSRESEVSNRQSGVSNGQTKISNRESERHSSYIKQEMTPPPLLKPSRPRGNKRQQGGKKGKNYNPSLKKISQNGGMFTEAEMIKLDNFRDLYCQEQNMSRSQFNELIHANARGNVPAHELWNRLHDLVAYRTRMSVSRFCRRHFHNYSARGTWTNSEDERLGLAVEEKGKLWTKVGAMIGRFPEDCRDRYRNYHGTAEFRNREQWTDVEVWNLCKSVYECMADVKAEKRRVKEEKYAGRDMPESEVESDPDVLETKLIHWASVSDRMGSTGGGRSRLQCILKWGNLKSAERRNYWKQVRAVIRSMKPPKNGVSFCPSAGWRIRKSLKKLKNMRIGDRYDFLQAFSTCGASIAGNIPWLTLGDEEFRAKWSTCDRKAAWIILKGEVPDADKLDLRYLINRMLMNLMANNKDKLDERWDPALHGDVNHLRKDKRKERKAQRALERQLNAVVVSGKIKSKAFVGSSDEDDDNHPPRSHQNQSPEAGVSGGGGDENGIDSAVLPDSEAERQQQQQLNGQESSSDNDNEDDKEFDAVYGYVSDELTSQIQLLADA